MIKKKKSRRKERKKMKLVDFFNKYCTAITWHQNKLGKMDHIWKSYVFFVYPHTHTHPICMYLLEHLLFVYNLITGMLGEITMHLA